MGKYFESREQKERREREAESARLAEAERYRKKEAQEEAEKKRRYEEAVQQARAQRTPIFNNMDHKVRDILLDYWRSRSDATKDHEVVIKSEPPDAWHLSCNSRRVDSRGLFRRKEVVERNFVLSVELSDPWLYVESYGDQTDLCNVLRRETRMPVQQRTLEVESSYNSSDGTHGPTGGTLFESD